MTSFARTISATPTKTHSTREDFETASHGQTASRNSGMVSQDHPRPAPRPSPDLAHEVDRMAFDQRWEEEAKQARKATFMAKRRRISRQFNRAHKR